MTERLPNWRRAKTLCDNEEWSRKIAGELDPVSVRSNRNGDHRPWSTKSTRVRNPFKRMFLTSAEQAATHFKLICIFRPRNLDRRTTITIDDKTFEVDADDLEKLCDLGRGAYGIVEKMRHRQTNTEMAVKRITHTVNSQEQKRLLMDLDISMRASACPYTVHFYGALFREGDVWICMEVMDTSLDKFYPRIFKNDRKLGEDILGKVSKAIWLIPGIADGRSVGRLLNVLIRTETSLARLIVCVAYLSIGLYFIGSP